MRRRRALVLGNRDGSFQLAQSYATGSGPSGVVVRDFNGDGIPDLATSNGKDTTLSVLLGNGDGSFQFPLNHSVGVSSSSLAVGDFNGAGFPDIIVGSRIVSVLLNAAVWSGGSPDARPQPRRPTLRTTASKQLHLDPLSARFLAHAPETIGQLSPTFIGLPAIALPARPFSTDRAEPAGSEADSPPRALLSAPHVQDVVLDGWSDAVTDLLAWDWPGQG